MHEETHQIIRFTDGTFFRSTVREIYSSGAYMRGRANGYDVVQPKQHRPDQDNVWYID